MQHWQWRRSVESGWFYATWFCLFAAAVLFVMQSKYGERQAGIERRFQARSQPLPTLDGAQAPADAETVEAYYSTPDDTVIPLWPLAVVMVVLSCTFGIFAIRVGFRRASDESIAK